MGTMLSLLSVACVYSVKSGRTSCVGTHLALVLGTLAFLNHISVVSRIIGLF